MHPYETSSALPRLLVIDDLFGRRHRDGANEERRSLCGQFLLVDMTSDEPTGSHSAQKIKHPLAEVVFCRGQSPADATVGDCIENDLEGTLAFVHQHWTSVERGEPPLAMVLLDLCFYTGRVTEDSEGNRGWGIPEGCEGDDRPGSYFGLRVLEALHDNFPELPVVILSSMPREDVSQRFTRLGALGFLPRGDSDSPVLLRDYLWRHGLVADASGTVVGRSKAVLLALRAARRAAAGRKNVLIRGETGTGKELLARYLHDQRPDGGNKPLITVDSGALSPSLFASELFGHRRGAYTGAVSDRTGRIVQANGGDLFLDEIGNMPEDVQVGLLRAIDQKVVTPLGATEGQEVDVRFITATNEDIEEKASTGRGFRADLYYRLREGGVIYMPLLRERRDDIPLLVERFVRDAEGVIPGAFRRTVDPEAMELLTRHDWPGNVRELRNCILKAVSDHSDVEYLMPVHLRITPKRTAPAPVRRTVNPAHDAELAGIDPNGAIGLLDRFSADRVQPGDFAGKLPLLRAAYARLVGRLVLAAINATRRPTVENPEGDILIHPAMKLLIGDSTLTASQAADIIKRVLSIDDKVHEELMGDVTLHEAYKKSVSLRPKGNRRNKGGRSNG